MRILGLMVVKDEAHRWLQAVIGHALERVVDDLLVYDDQSTDASVLVATKAGATVSQRPGGASFLEDESRFRQLAWSALDEEFSPSTDDWVLSIDADELVVAPDGSLERDRLVELAQLAHARAYGSVQFPVAECFAIHDGRPLIRRDGWWGSINAARFAQWTGDVIFRRAELAGGSLPASVAPCMTSTESITYLHLGYAHPEDRLAKFDRYRGRGGHSRKHVQSIVAPPTLEPWYGEMPGIWRGTRASHE